MTKFRGRMEFSFSYPLYDTPYISLTNMDDYFIDIRRRACKSAPRVMLKQLGGSGWGMELRVWGVSGNALRRKLVVLFTVGVFYGRDAGRPVWRPASLNALHLVWGGSTSVAGARRVPWEWYGVAVVWKKNYLEESIA